MKPSILQCIVVEDEPLAQEIISDHIRATPLLKLAGLATNAFEATDLVAQLKPDLIFLDINLPQLDGISWLADQKGGRLNVILTTANPNYAIKGFELAVIDYLLKPIRLERFNKALIRVSDVLQVRPVTDFFVKDGKEQIKVNFQELIYIESMDDYSRLHLTNRSIMNNLRMHQLETMLPSPPFYRLNRSTIVNAAFITNINGPQVTLTTGFGCTVSNKYKESFLEMKEYIG